MKKYILIVIILVIAIVAGIFIKKSITGDAVITGNSINNIKSETKEFTVKAFRFGYTPNTISINKGDKVKIIVDNTDTLHGIRIPELNVKGNEILEFTADKTGTFTFFCSVQCGEGHSNMKGTLIVNG